jgi:hypothetical protein
LGHIFMMRGMHSAHSDSKMPIAGNEIERK